MLADRTSGASEVEIRLAEVLRAASDVEVPRLVETLPSRLAATFPQMGNLLDLAEEVSQASGPAAFRDLMRRRAEEAAQGQERLSTAVAPLLPAGDLLVFSLSKSSTVMTVLLDLHRSGRRLAVLVAESRPGGEGARMARDLAERGIHARACDDLLLLSLVPPEAMPRRPPGYTGSPVVLVGADAVHPDALVNKVGTRALLSTARLSGVPAFVLAASSKVRKDEAPRALGSLFEAIPRDGVVVLTESGFA